MLKKHTVYSINKDNKEVKLYLDGSKICMSVDNNSIHIPSDLLGEVISGLVKIKEEKENLNITLENVLKNLVNVYNEDNYNKKTSRKLKKLQEKEKETFDFFKDF